MTTAQRLITALALTASLAVAATPASARPFNLNANGSYVLVPPTPESGPSTGSTGQPAIIRVTGRNGFAWGDAGIGAAGGIALLVILLGGALTASHQRGRRIPTPRI
jgi:hypothetical protein